jgi:hypothetical protein
MNGLRSSDALEMERPFIAKSLLDRHEPMPGLRGP